jgi:hypothetical protein
MAIRPETENLKSCNAPFPKPASVVLKRTLLAVLVNIPSPLYPVIYPATMISTRVPPAVVCQKTGGAERGKYLLSVAYRKMRALNHTLPASCWTLIVRARMFGVSEISEDLTNYGSSCHPEALPKAGKR